MALFRRRPRDRVDDEPLVDDRVVDETVVRPAEDRVVEEEVYEEPPPRRPPRIWPWLLLLALLVLAGLGALWYFTTQDDDEADTVPALVGLTEREAVERVADEGFEPVVQRRPSERPRGRVFAQRPGGGSQLDEGEAVVLLVSRGVERTTVPDVVGLRVDEALERLTAADLRARTRRVFSERPVREVVAQDPRAGGRAAKGSEVRLNVSKGTGRVAVPDVVGRTAAEAGSILRRAGLRPKVFEVPSNEREGTVIAQNPQPQAEVGRGDFVRINVSTGEAGEAGGQAAAVNVPDVVGQDINAGRNRLQEAGFVVRVDIVPSTEPEGRIVAQNPAAGTAARRGANVRLNVSEGPQPTARVAISDVVGLTQAEARRELTTAGFRVRVFDEPTPDPAEVGFVVRQEPQAGRRAPRGAEVAIYVGRTSG